MLPLEEEQLTALPERQPTKPLPNDVEARQQAYYATFRASKRSLKERADITIQAQQETFKNLYGKIHNDLTTTGTSPELEQEKSSLVEKTLQDKQQDLLDIATDPTIPIEQKTNVFLNQKEEKPDLREAYRTSVASENHGVTLQDDLVQEKRIDNFIPNNIKAEQDYKNLHSAYVGQLNVTTPNVVASIGAGLIPIRNGVIVANMYAAMTNDNSLFTKGKNIVLPGSANAAMGKLWKEWDSSEKRDGLIRIVKRLESMHLFDTERLQTLMQIVENPDQPWWATSIENVAGVLDAILVGSFIKNPIKNSKDAIKWISTYDAAKDKAAVDWVRNKFTTGKVAGADVGVKAAKAAVDEAAVIQAATKNEPPPNSPLGIEVVNNPDRAAKTVVASILDETEDVAKAVAPGGKGQVIETALPKSVFVNDLSTIYPDVAERINTYAKALRPESQVNPALYDDVFQRSEINKEIETISRTKYPSLQLSNTVIDFRFGDTTYIKAIYGETPTRGWASEVEAKSMLSKLPKESVANMEVSYFPKNKEWYITHTIEKEFTPNVYMKDDYGTNFQIPYTTKEVNLD